MKNVLKNKGKGLKLTTFAFTLVELLAVVVILAIILIIAVPGVLSIINKTKHNALNRQKDMIKEASRLYITSDSDVTWVGQDTKMTTVSLDVLKTKGYLDQKILDPKTKQEITCAKTIITKTGSKYDYDVQLCDQVNRSPRLSSNMIPIVYQNGKWVKADYTNQNNAWYDYDNQQWANMATVTKETREAYKKADIGTEVKMDDMNTMFTWIPRFKYKLFNVDGTISPVGNVNLAGDYVIDVQLEDINTPKSKGSQNGEWLTHPAFTFGGEELEGFWMAKFETGYKDATVSDEGIVNETDGSKVVVKPNVYSWRGANTSHMFDTSREMKDSTTFGMTNIEDPHMIRNIEWGAMAYLTQSKYGKQGNSDYSGDAKKVQINNNKQYLTGCGADPTNVKGVDTCNPYDTPYGMSASTTGNITGVYDTSGGVWEAVAAVMKTKDGVIPIQNTGFKQTDLNNLGQAGKYLEVYEWIDFPNEIPSDLGIGMIELGPFSLVNINSSNLWLGSWHGNGAQFPCGDRLWVYRSANWSQAEYAGPLSLLNSNGFSVYDGWRIVVV